MYNRYKGEYINSDLLKITHPVGRAGWYATVKDVLWIWSEDDNKWIQSSGLSEDVIAYIDGSISTSNAYPVDYVSPDQTIIVKQYENYEVHNPLVVDGIFINDGTVIIN